MAVLTAFLVPDLYLQISGFITIPCIIAEVWIAGYLVTVGVNSKNTKIVELIESVPAPV